MVTIIVKIKDSWESDRQDAMIQAALNYGFTTFIASGDVIQKLAAIERIRVLSWNGKLEDDENSSQKNKNKEQQNIIPVWLFEKEKETKYERILEKQLDDMGLYFTISSKEDEENAVSWARKGISFIIAKPTNWKIIPFENLIAKLSTLETQVYADVENSVEDADLLIHTLEIGVDGIVFSPESENELIDLKKVLKTSFNVRLTKGKITDIIPIVEADRVCVDTTSLLRPGEGMLVGSTAKGFALVHAEVFDSEFVNSRPFRVNAGDVSEYILVPEEHSDGTLSYRTNYLSELKAGEKVFVFNTEGEARIVTVGRVKIETRPMLLFKVEVEQNEKEQDNNKNNKKKLLKIPFTVCIQNAETVRLVGKDKKAISGTLLKKGDEILVHIGPGATHFGTKIKETIIEK